MLAEYHRGGGSRPADDETLEIDDDGSFVLTRTVGGPRVGRFAGTLSQRARASLAGLVAGAEDHRDAPTGLPPHVTETVTTDGAEILVAAFARSGGPAVRLVKRMRELADELTREPVAALALALAADGRSITLESVGSGAVEVDLSEAAFGYTLFGDREELLSDGDIACPPDLRAASSLAPGWSIELPLGDIDMSPKRTLDVIVDFDLLDGGRSRRARLRATAGKGWSG